MKWSWEACLLMNKSCEHCKATKGCLSSGRLFYHLCQNSFRPFRVFRCFRNREILFFLFLSWHSPVGMDGVDVGFYLGVHSQGKACRRNIEDVSPAMMKSFFIFAKIVNVKVKVKVKVNVIEPQPEILRSQHIYRSHIHPILTLVYATHGSQHKQERRSLFVTLFNYLISQLLQRICAIVD